ncbi:MAG: hypothetical protein H6Q86_5363 [candidate division NC10 bacterium]|nr:hypothetical protein [candidate division NC10 bacterium]
MVWPSEPSLASLGWGSPDETSLPVPTAVVLKGDDVDGVATKEVAGHPGRALAPLLGVRSVSVYAAARRGLADRGRWDALMERP